MLTDGYIQPVINWLHIHPQWALFIAFSISFAESLAIIGSIVPGSVTMTAIGILAGSGIMRVDLTLIAATLGAVAGDSASYLLGYFFSDKISAFWPFSRYPGWLTYGKSYFARHGGKSVIIGRFVGPLRSIIPVIAGMLHMSQWRFFSANVVSAIAWSILYVVPGVLIGNASAELPPEKAGKLFALVLITLVGVWLISLVVKWILYHGKRFTHDYFHRFWRLASKNSFFSPVLAMITPDGEEHHYQTVSLFIKTLACLIALGFVLIGVLHQPLGSAINEPVYHFLQSLKISIFDVFFIRITQIIGRYSLLFLFLYVLILMVYYKNWRALKYWISLHLSCGLMIFLCLEFIITPTSPHSIRHHIFHSWPVVTLTFATTQFFSVLFYINNYFQGRLTDILNITLPLILFITGLALLYLGNFWLLDIVGSYFMGLSICLLHWIFYRAGAGK